MKEFKQVWVLPILLVVSLFLLVACSSQTPEPEQKADQVGRIDSIQNGTVTIQPGQINVIEGNNPPETTVDDFIPEGAKEELSVGESGILANFQVGDVVSFCCSKENVIDRIESIAKAPKYGEVTGERMFCRIDSIDGDKVTVTVGNINHTANDQPDSVDAQEHLASEFVPSAETLTLTEWEGTSQLDGLKPGDVVAVWCNKKNVLERIHVPYGFIGCRNPARIESIEGNTVKLLLGSINPDDSGATPAENFVPGTEEVTLTAPDPSILEGFKAGDVVMVRYNDQNQLEQIHVPGSGQGTGQGNGMGPGHGMGHHRGHSQN